MATPRLHHELTLTQELVADLDGHIHEAPGIVPEIKNEPLHAPRPKVREGIHEFVVCSPRETIETDVSRSLVEHVVCVEGVEWNFVARDREVKQLRIPWTLDGDFDFGAARPLERALTVGIRESDRRRIVDRDDSIARVEPCGLARATGKRIKHGNRVPAVRTIYDLEGNADPFEGRIEVLLHVPHLLGIDVDRVRIEPTEHSFDGTLGQHGGVDVVNVPLIDRHEGALELLERLVCIIPRDDGPQFDAEENSDRKNGNGESDEFVVPLHTSPTKLTS